MHRLIEIGLVVFLIIPCVLTTFSCSFYNYYDQKMNSVEAEELMNALSNRTFPLVISDPRSRSDQWTCVYFKFDAYNSKYGISYTMENSRRFVGGYITELVKDTHAAYMRTNVTTRGNLKNYQLPLYLDKCKKWTFLHVSNDELYISCCYHSFFAYRMAYYFTENPYASNVNHKKAIAMIRSVWWQQAEFKNNTACPKYSIDLINMNHTKIG